jgi:4-aminobutyrate aminotransferase-like enzyme
MGKPMGAGHPLAAVAGRPEVLEKFGRTSRYFNTFGGNPVSCAAGMAVLDVIEGQDLMGNAQRVGAAMREAIAGLSSAVIKDVRGAGLFIGVELADAESAARIVNGMRERRVLISATGPGANVLKVRPPLVFAMEHAEVFLDALRAELAAL